MLSIELQRFCRQWLRKAEQYRETSVHDCYDKFFTLFVVFNRLYAEATFELARRGEVSLQPNRQLPDRMGATEYTLRIIGIGELQNLYEARLSEHVEEIARLIEAERFYIKLSATNGERQRDKDLELLAKLRSTGKTRLLAILDLVYTIRCNMFHGHKAFLPIQVALLRPTIGILTAVIGALRQSLAQQRA